MLKKTKYNNIYTLFKICYKNDIYIYNVICEINIYIRTGCLNAKYQGNSLTLLQYVVSTCQVDIYCCLIGS